MNLAAVSATTALILFLAVAALMIVEARRSAINERTQRSRGGLEPAGDIYAVMQIAYPAIFMGMLAEGAWRGATAGGALFAGGLTIFALAKLLKWWAIRSLGPCWTFRIIVVPGSASIVSGPYRIMRHPNYVAVVGEIVGVAMMMRARIAGPVALVVFGTLLLRRIAVENRVRDAILRRG